MLLAIDIGNTRTKAAVCEGSSIIKYFAFDSKYLQDQVSQIIFEFKTISDIIISSVGPGLIEPLNFENITIHTVSNSWRFPFVNLYTTPHTLGIDRMVLAAGAVLGFPGTNRLVIDAGTCITYDFINEKDQYLGGAISPGIRLRYEALHKNTARLPLLSAEIPRDVIGNSTENAIHSGVINGIVFEIEGFINKYTLNTGNFIIILTGGDGDFLATRLKNTIFANSNFLLESLNQTFQYQTSND